MILLRLFLLLMILYGYSNYIKNKLNISLIKSSFFSLVFIMFVMSIFSLINKMLIGFYLIIFLGMILFFLDFIKTKKINFKYLYIVALVLLLFLITRQLDLLKNWDECSYWATMVKRLFYFDSYIGADNFHSMYYPPAITSFNYFVVKIIGFSDSNLYFSQYLFITFGIMFLSFDCNKGLTKFSAILKSLITGFILVLFLILSMNNYLLTLYSEIPLIILIGTCIYLMFTYKKRIDIIMVCVCLMNATWIKSNGIVCCSIVILMAISQLIFYLLNCNKKGKTFSNILKTFKEKFFLVYIMISPIIAYLAFSVFLKVFKIENFQKISFQLIEFIRIICKKNDKRYIVSNFLDALSQNYFNSFFNISCILIIFLVIAVFIIIKSNSIVLCKDNKIFNKNKYFSICLMLSFIFYIVSLLYSYIFMFSLNEANILASFDRYINTFVCSVVIAFICILINELKINYKMKFIYIVLFLLLIVTKYSAVYKFILEVFPIFEEEKYVEIEQAKYIAQKYKNAFNDNDKIGFIIEEDYGLSVWALIYYLTPNKLYDPRFDGDLWSITSNDDSELKNVVVISPEDYLAFIEKENITHVIVVRANDQFSLEYNTIFETNNENDIVEGLYKFDFNNRVFSYEY